MIFGNLEIGKKNLERSKRPLLIDVLDLYISVLSLQVKNFGVRTNQP